MSLELRRYAVATGDGGGITNPIAPSQSADMGVDSERFIVTGMSTGKGGKLLVGNLEPSETNRKHDSEHSTGHNEPQHTLESDVQKVVTLGGRVGNEGGGGGRSDGTKVLVGEKFTENIFCQVYEVTLVRGVRVTKSECGNT